MAAFTWADGKKRYSLLQAFVIFVSSFLTHRYIRLIALVGHATLAGATYWRQYLLSVHRLASNETDEICPAALAEEILIRDPIKHVPIHR